MGKAAESWCSSIDSSNHPSAALSSASSLSFPNSTAHLIISTDLRLAPSHDYYEFSSTSTSTPTREERRLHWPPIKPLLRSTLAGTADYNRRPCRQASLFVKVYMEGIPIGRKLDLFLHHGYHALVTTLAHMFTTTIIWPDADGVDSQKYHVLTYEDKEGDWMMVGDVPWEMFLSTVKRLKIKRADRC